MKAALVTRLNGSALLAAVAGAAVAWDERPRAAALPAITLNLVSGGRAYTHDGHDGVDGPRVQCDVWDTNWERLQALKAALIEEMERQDFVDTGGVRFWPAFVELEQSGPPEDLEGGQKLFREIIDFGFHWETL